MKLKNKKCPNCKKKTVKLDDNHVHCTSCMWREHKHKSELFNITEGILGGFFP